MKRLSMSLIATLSMMSTTVMAESPRGYVDAYFVSDAQIEEPDTQGDGYGFKGALSLAGSLFLTGEYQDVSYDDAVADFDGDDVEDRIGFDLNQMRIGLGYRAPVSARTQGLVRAEYLDMEADADAQLSNEGAPVSGTASVDDDGYGVHAGLRGENGRLGVTATIGFLDVADLDGAEYEIEADYRVSDWIGAFIGYRVSDLSADSGGDLKLQDLRVGLSLYLGG